MSVRLTIIHWRDAGLTPRQALEGLGLGPDRNRAPTWAEVEAACLMADRMMARNPAAESYEVAA